MWDTSIRCVDYDEVVRPARERTYTSRINDMQIDVE